MKTHRAIVALLSAALLICAVGCDTAQPDEVDTNASEDVALSVLTLVSEDTGGLLDQVSDVFDLAAAGSIPAQTTALASKHADADSVVERTYDEATGTWTISIERERGTPDGPRYMRISRVYQVQFLNADGVPQQFFVTDADTAHSINFTIVEGSGSLETPHLSAERTNITGQWVATGVNTDQVTVNGTYGRSGAHTLTTHNAVRTLDYGLAVEVVDLVGPRGSRRHLAQKVSGTIHGTYEGKATFTRGNLYRERDISRTVTIVIENGEATITVNGEPFGGNVQTGDAAMNP
ncbi:MAG: hypothetical protein ACE5G0_15490 [Rhodothermales bacterium]